MTIPVLAKGTYPISYKYNGDKNYYSKSGKSKLVIQNPATKISASTLKMDYNDGSKFKVKLTTNSGKALSNEDVKIKVNGKSYTKNTNSKGIAKFTIKTLTLVFIRWNSIIQQKGHMNIVTDQVRLSFLNPVLPLVQRIWWWIIMTVLNIRWPLKTGQANYLKMYLSNQQLTVNHIFSQLIQRVLPV